MIPPENTSEYEFDSARFNWNIDTLPGWGYGYFSIYSPDSTDLYAINDVGDYLVRINNNNQTKYYFNNFSPHFIGGLNENEIYIGGGKLSGSTYIPHIKKWVGGSFQDIDIPTNDSLEAVISAGIIKSGTEMWFATPTKIIKYNGSQFDQYIYSDTPRAVSGFFLKDGYKPTIVANYLNEQIDTIFRNYIYELDGDTAVKTFQNTWYPGFPNYTWMRVANEEIYGIRSSVISKFSFPYFAPYVMPPSPFWFSSGDMIAGNSLDDFIVMIYDYSFSYSNYLETIHHWDGKRFSNEHVGLTLTLGIKNMQRMNEDYFICVVQDLLKNSRTYIFRGTRKK